MLALLLVSLILSLPLCPSLCLPVSAEERAELPAELPDRVVDKTEPETLPVQTTASEPASALLSAADAEALSLLAATGSTESMPEVPDDQQASAGDGLHTLEDRPVVHLSPPPEAALPPETASEAAPETVSESVPEPIGLTPATDQAAFFHDVSLTLKASASLEQLEPYVETGEGPAVLMTIPNLVAGVADNLDVALAENRKHQAGWERFAVASQMLPSIRGEWYMEKLTGSTVILDQIPLSINRVTRQPRVYLDYDLSVKPLLQWRVASARHRQSAQILDQTRQQVLLDALTGYYQWKRDLAGVAVAQQSLKEAREQKALSESRFETGFGTRLDIEQSAVVAAERQSDFNQAINKQAMSKLDLRLTLNVPTTLAMADDAAPLLPRDWLQDGAVHTATLNDWLTYAMENRPDLKAMTAMIEEARASFWAAASDAIPKMQLTAYVGNTGPEPGEYRRSYQRGVRLSVDVLRFLGLNYASTLVVQHDQVKAALLTREKELNRIKRELADAYFQWQLAQRQLEAMTAKLNSAQEAYRIAGARKAHGVGINLEVTQAQTQLVQARQTYFDAVQAYNVAQLKLLFEAGDLTPQRLGVTAVSEAP
ncbi:MAG: TolC family protein [Candidatus Melainabacteria bacterium]